VRPSDFMLERLSRSAPLAERKISNKCKAYQQAQRIGPHVYEGSSLRYESLKCRYLCSRLLVSFSPFHRRKVKPDFTANCLARLGGAAAIHGGCPWSFSRRRAATAIRSDTQEKMARRFAKLVHLNNDV